MAQIDVTTTAAKASEPLNSALTEVILYHQDATNIIYLGMAADVSASNGLPLIKGVYLSLEIKPYETVYAVSSAGTVKLYSLTHVSPHARHS